MANALSRLTPHIGRVSWYRSTCAAPHLLRMPAELLWHVLSYLPASQTVGLHTLMQHHHRYYSGVEYRFPVAVGTAEEVKEDEEMGVEEGAEEKQRQVVQDVSLDCLYDVVPLPAGVEAGTLRLHPQALLMMR